MPFIIFIIDTACGCRGLSDYKGKGRGLDGGCAVPDSWKSLLVIIIVLWGGFYTAPKFSDLPAVTFTVGGIIPVAGSVAGCGAAYPLRIKGGTVNAVAVTQFARFYAVVTAQARYIVIG